MADEGSGESRASGNTGENDDVIAFNHFRFLEHDVAAVVNGARKVARAAVVRVFAHALFNLVLYFFNW
jgi:hypothetical protein